jgi:hypothetical protein
MRGNLNVESSMRLGDLEDIVQSCGASVPGAPGKPGLGRSISDVLSQLICGFAIGHRSNFPEQRGRLRTWVAECGASWHVSA